MQMISEVGAFSAAGLMMGYLGETAMAAHQIALMCAATAFMMPLGLSMALSVKIGSARGAGQIDRLRTIAVSGWWLGAGYSLFGGLFFFLCGEWLASLFIDEMPVIRMAAAMMIVVGVFQLFDSLQVTSVSMLRGLHDVTIPAWMGFVAYWLVGIPCAVLFSMQCA